MNPRHDEGPPDQIVADEGPQELTPNEALRWYISKFESSYGQSTIPFADQLRKVLSPTARLRAKVIATDAQAPRARRAAAAHAASGKPLKLHLGCGWNYLDGWINCDLVGGKIDIAWNLLKPLPFPNASVDAIFTEHVFEHMSYSQALLALSHCREALKPGGVLRVGVPDAGMYAQMYADDPEGLRTFRWGRPAPMFALREVFQEHAHVSAYDAETLLLILDEAGFPGAIVTAPGTSTLLDPAPDMPERWSETVYAEVRRPSDESP